MHFSVAAANCSYVVKKTGKKNKSKLRSLGIVVVVSPLTWHSHYSGKPQECWRMAELSWFSLRGPLSSLTNRWAWRFWDDSEGSTLCKAVKVSKSVEQSVLGSWPTAELLWHIRIASLPFKLRFCCCFGKSAVFTRCLHTMQAAHSCQLIRTKCWSQFLAAVVCNFWVTVWQLLASCSLP